MTRALLLALSLAMAAPYAGAAITGKIGVQITIVSRCAINSQSMQDTPQIMCGNRAATEPRVTETMLSPDALRRESAKLITVEW